MSSIELVTKVSRLRRDFPDTWGNRVVPRAIAAMSYAIDRSRLSGKLAEFLADNISTTRFDDDAGRLSIYRRETHTQVWVMEGRGYDAASFGQTMMRQAADLDHWEEFLKRELQKVEQWQRRMAVYGDKERAAGNQHPVTEYRWPVFDETYEDAADYLNRCAGAIRSLGIPFHAGLRRATPPDSLLRTIDEVLLRHFHQQFGTTPAA